MRVGRDVFGSWLARRGSAQFLDGAGSDAISLAQSAVDSAGFGDAHLGAQNHRRHIGRIRIAEADKSFAAAAFVNRGLKGPASRFGITELLDRLYSNS